MGVKRHILIYSDQHSNQFRYYEDRFINLKLLNSIHRRHLLSCLNFFIYRWCVKVIQSCFIVHAEFPAEVYIFLIACYHTDCSVCFVQFQTPLFTPSLANPFFMLELRKHITWYQWVIWLWRFNRIDEEKTKLTWSYLNFWFPPRRWQPNICTGEPLKPTLSQHRARISFRISLNPVRMNIWLKCGCVKFLAHSCTPILSSFSKLSVSIHRNGFFKLCMAPDA